MIWSPEAVVMGCPAVWAETAKGPEKNEVVRAIERLRKCRRCMYWLSLYRGRKQSHGRRARSIAKRAAVLARIGAARQRALVPIDPDCLPAAERRDEAGRLVPELLQAF